MHLTGNNAYASSFDAGCWEGLCRPMPRRRICGHPAYHPTRIAPPVTAKSARPPTARPAEWPGFCGPKASKTKGETHRSNPREKKARTRGRCGSHYLEDRNSVYKLFARPFSSTHQTLFLGYLQRRSGEGTRKTSSF